MSDQSRDPDYRRSIVASMRARAADILRDAAELERTIEPVDMAKIEEDVRRAVEAEREACALAALDEIKGKHPQDYHREIGTASRIAKRIRARAEVRRG